MLLQLFPETDKNIIQLFHFIYQTTSGHAISDDLLIIISFSLFKLIIKLKISAPTSLKNPKVDLKYQTSNVVK